MENITPAEEEIDKNPDFAVIWSFFCTFGKHLELENVTIEDMIKWFPAKANRELIVSKFSKIMAYRGIES